MNRRPFLIFLSAALLTVTAVRAADTPPATASILPAHPAWTTDPVRKCPELRVADDGAAAVVVFHVSAMGAPSQASVRTSSGSPAFDAAAVECVMKLRFNVATRFGDGVPVDSWQSIGWRQVSPPHQLGAGAVTAPAAAAGAVAGTATAAPAASGAGVPRTVGVRACADAAGKLARDPQVVRSSGDAALDAAAVNIAKSGAGYYRTAPASSGCAQLQIQFE
jgi:TonB family protein